MKKTRANPTLSDSTNPTLFHKREKSITNFLPFACQKQVEYIVCIRSSPPPPAPPVPRPFKVYEPAITQGATFVNQNVAPLVRHMCDAWKVQVAKGFFFLLPDGNKTVGGDALRKKLRARFISRQIFWERTSPELWSRGTFGRSGPLEKNLHNYLTPQNGRFGDIKIDQTHEEAQACQPIR